MSKDAAPPEKTAGSELTEEASWQPVLAEPSEGGRAAPVCRLVIIFFFFTTNSEREQCICQSHNTALGL